MAVRDKPCKGDRVQIDCLHPQHIGIVVQVSESAVRVVFDGGSSGTYPLHHVDVRNDLIRVKPGIYESVHKNDRIKPNDPPSKASFSGSDKFSIVLASLVLVLAVIQAFLNKP